MSAAPVEEFEVEDLDASGVLEAAAEAELAERRASAMKLRLAHQWAILNPATAETGVATPGGPALDVLTRSESLGGDGTPAVAAFTPEPFALKLGISPAAGAQLIGDALDLRHRLPLLWKRVQRLQVPTWQARRVAQQTHTLPLAGARWVDHRLAIRTDGSLGPVITDRLVALATAKYDPEAHQQREANATAASEVTLSHPHPTLYTGTSDLAATGDTLILEEFYDLLCAIARQLWLDGDTDPLGVRKIKAIGLITAMVSGQASPRPPSAVLGSPPSPRRSGKIRLYVLVDADDLDIDADGGAAFAVGAVEKLGAATMAKLRQWVGHHQVEILPVLNMAPPRRRRPPRPTRVDARARRAPRRPLRLPPLHRPRQELRQGPHHRLPPARGRRTTRPNPPRRPRLPVPTTPPRQNRPRLALCPHARRPLPLARPPRRHLPRHRHRHPPPLRADRS